MFPAGCCRCIWLGLVQMSEKCCPGREVLLTVVLGPLGVRPLRLGIIQVRGHQCTRLGGQQQCRTIRDTYGDDEL